MALQSSALKELDEQLTCVVCLDQYTNPKTLPCLHSFCLKCIEKLPQEPQGDKYFISCPICRIPTQLPDIGATEFPTAFHINSLVQLQAIRKKASENLKVSCDNCHKNSAIGYCKQCTQFLCPECLEMHIKQKALSTHEVINVKVNTSKLLPLNEDKNMKCNDHNEPIKVYFETCQELICRDCTVSKRHRNHDYNLITESYPKHCQEIEASLAKVRTQYIDAPISPETHAALIKGIKEGSGDVNLALILLHGAPSVGKSSIHRILQGLPPLLKSQQHSTELLQNPVRLINTNRFALTATRVLEHVDERKVMNMIAAHISRQGKESTTEEIPQATSKTTPQTKMTKNESPTRDQVVVSDVVKGNAAELSNVTSISSDLFNVLWFHLVDSGGQPQFSDVLPLVFPKVSLHIVVIRLDEKLDDKPKVRYLFAGEDKYVVPENLALSHLQMIERTCELAQAAATTNPKGHCPWVMVLGTHLDCICPEESLQEKNRRLQEVFERYKHIIVRTSGKEMIFAMNAMAPVGKERDEYTRVLQDRVFHAPLVHTNDVPVPARWMLFHLELSRLSEEGVLEMSTCIKVADRIQMRDDVKNAFNYFTNIGLHMHFPDVLPHLLFTELKPFVSRLSQILAASFTEPEFGPIEEERENLRVNGIVTKSFVQKLFDGKFKEYPFSVEDFFSLLQYLRIAVKTDLNSYFIPCVLPLENPNPADFPKECTPVLLTWNNKVLPQGFFPALIVHLLQRKIAPVFSRCAGEKQLRRAVYLNSQYGALLIVDQTLWFELYFAGKREHSQIMLKAIEESSHALSNKMDIHGFGELNRGFLCTGICGNKDTPHPALLLTQSNEAQCTKRDAYRFDLSSEHTCWIDSQTNCDCGILEESDTSDVLRATANESRWFMLGVELHVSHATLERIKLDYRQAQECQYHMLHAWISSGNATWCKLIAALRSPVLGNLQLAQEIEVKYMNVKTEVNNTPVMTQVMTEVNNTPVMTQVMTEVNNTPVMTHSRRWRCSLF